MFVLGCWYATHAAGGSIFPRRRRCNRILAGRHGNGVGCGSPFLGGNLGAHFLGGHHTCFFSDWITSSDARAGFSVGHHVADLPADIFIRRYSGTDDHRAGWTTGISGSAHRLPVCIVSGCEPFYTDAGASSSHGARLGGSWLRWELASLGYFPQTPCSPTCFHCTGTSPCACGL